jgi:hypothetical protein
MAEMMLELTADKQNYRRDLGDGLVLRWSTPADCDGVLELYHLAFRRKPEDEPRQTTIAWVGSMFRGKNPCVTPYDFALVEDTNSGKIVAATFLFRQPFLFGGIEMMMGRPEMVATLHEYRNRGLVRAIFDLLHARSEARGDQIQGITGINYFYRQFGYEYALDLSPEVKVPFARIPALPEGQSEALRARDTRLEDLPILAPVFAREATILRRLTPASQPMPALVSSPWPLEYQRYQVDFAETGLPEWFKTLYTLVDHNDRPVGFFATWVIRFDEALGISSLMLSEEISWVEVLPSLLRALASVAGEKMVRNAEVPPASLLNFDLPGSHPIYELLDERYVSSRDRFYPWYLRVSHLPDFVKTIRPILEERLAKSVMAGYSGELKLDFYRDGLRLVFEKGSITTVEPWRKPIWEAKADAGFPPLLFTKLLFSYQDLPTLMAGFPDLWATEEAQSLLQILFPVLPSSLQGIG